MKKIRVYTIVCSYEINGEVKQIELDKMLERLQIAPTKYCWGIDYNVNKVVEWSVEKLYRTKYMVIIKKVNNNYIFGVASRPELLQSTVDYMNSLHDGMINGLNESELLGYGNNYTEQCAKKGRYIK